MSGRVSTFVTGITGDGVGFGQESEELVAGRLPLDRKLLQVDDLVGVHDLFNEVTSLLIVH